MIAATHNQLATESFSDFILNKLTWYEQFTDIRGVTFLLYENQSYMLLVLLLGEHGVS